jgi:RNA polymerase sigma-70 factor (ECF subfamily)
MMLINDVFTDSIHYIVNILIGLKNMQHQVTNSNLVKKIRLGDSKSFEKLFMTYCQPLINFARRFIRDTSTAENIVQDVFLEIWINRSRLDPSLKIKSYLYTAVKNQALKQIRHDHVVQRSAKDLKSFDIPIKTPQDELDIKEMNTRFHQAVEELPEKCRIIFSMNRFDQCTYSEIAEILGITVKTVETQMGRALKFLRHRLADFLSIFPH